MAGRFSIEAVFAAVDRFTRPVQRMQKGMQRFAKSTEKSMRQMTAASNAVIGGMKKIGAAAVAGGVVAGAAMANVVETGAEFEQQLVNAAAKFPGQIERTSDAFAALKIAASDVGAATEFSAGQAAEGLNFLAMAGFNAEQAIAALPGVVDLATASGLELGQATDIASDSLGAFKLMTSDSVQLGKNLAAVNDLLAKTTTTANTSMEMMFEAITTGAPTMINAGQSMETFASYVGTLANAGIKGSEAGTALRNMAIRLQAPAKAGADQIKALKLRITDASGNMRDMTNILGDMSAALEGMGTAQRAEIMNDIFGARAIGPATILLNSGADALREYRTRLEQADGAASSMAATMRDTTTGDINSMKSAIDSVKIAIFDVAGGAIRGLVKDITEWARANKELIATGARDFLQWWRDNLPEIIKWGERFGTVAGVLLSVAAAIKVASVAMAVFNAVAAANPVVLLVYAIAGAIALVLAFWPEISAFFAAIGRVATEAWGELVAGAEAAWSWVVSAASSAWDAIVGVLSAAGEWIRAVWVGVAEFVVGALTLAIQPLKPMIRPVLDFLGAAAEWVAERWRAFVGVMRRVWRRVAGAVNVAVDEVRAIAGEVADWIGAKFGAVWSRVAEFGAWAAGHVVAAWSTLFDFFAGLWTSIAEMFERIVGGVIDRVSGFIDEVRAVGRSVFGDEGGDSVAPRPSAQVMGPQERAAAVSREERSESYASTVEIVDRTGRAVFSGGGPGISFVPTGAG